MDLGKQWFLCPYYFVGLNEPLTEFENSDDGFPMLNFCKNAYPTSPVTTPDVRLMEKYLRVHAPEDRKGLTFSFGFAHFNFRFLLDLLIVFPDAKLYHSGRWCDPLWFQSEDGVGYLLPLRQLEGGKIPPETVLDD